MKEGGTKRKKTILKNWAQCVPWRNISAWH